MDESGTHSTFCPFPVFLWNILPNKVEFPRMGTNKVIATDLDGTLFYPRKRISMIPSRSKKFIKKFLRDGGRLVVVSGRNRYISAKVGKKLKAEVDHIGCNGAYIVSQGETIRETFFDVAFSKNLLREIRQEYNPPLLILMTRDRNMVLNRTDVTHFTNFGYFVYQYAMGVYKERFVRSDRVFREEMDKGDVYKINVMFGLTKKKKELAKEANRILREKYPQAEFSWIGEFIEITPKGCSKSEGLEFYLDYNGIPRDNVLVVGDSGNDISMFRAFPEHSFCMSHGPDDVKNKAKHVIDRFHELEEYIYPSEENTKQ